MDWSDVRCFLAVAEAGAFTRAARQLRLSTATLTRRLDRLERALDLTLMVRGPSGASLTPDGERLRAVADAGAREFDQMQRVAASLRGGRWSEPVRISATEPMITDVLAPALPALWRRDPELRVDLAVSTRLSSLASREADLAIRMARPTGTSLVARRLPNIELGCFASTAYCAGRNPETIDLDGERLLGFDESYGQIPERNWIAAAGLAGRVVCSTGSTNGLIRAVEAGAGVALLPVALALRRGLIRIAAPPIAARACWLVFHRDLRRNTSIRTARDWIVSACEAVFAAASGRRPSPRAR